MHISGCLDIVCGVRILVIGTGPVAVVLATSIAAGHEVTLATRVHTDGTRVLHSRARGLGLQRARTRGVWLVPLGSAEGDWDLVVSTAPPTSPEVAAALSGPGVKAIAAVTQVPSEVAELEPLAGDRPWGLLVPGFLAWDAEPTQFWRLGPLFTLAGSAAPRLQSLFPAKVPVTSATAALLDAATMMPVVAGLHPLDFDLRRASRQSKALARSANEARAAVAATAGLPAPRRVLPVVVWGALHVLPLIAPMNLRDYLHTHFGGHREQTEKLLAEWIAAAHNRGLGSAALEVTLNELKRGE